MREWIKPAELTRRLAEMPPRVLVVPDIPDDRILHERATEKNFGPQMRRMSLYAMSPNAYYRAECHVRAMWGVRPEWAITHTGTILNRRYIIPLRFPDGIREWEVSLAGLDQSSRISPTSLGAET